MQSRNINYASCVRDKLRGVKVLLCSEKKKNRFNLAIFLMFGELHIYSSIGKRFVVVHHVQDGEGVVVRAGRHGFYGQDEVDRNVETLLSFPG